MSYIGQGLPADTFQGFTTDKFTGDGTANKTFTLTKEPFSEDTILVTIDGVVQEPTDDFTVSGTTLTLVGTAANGSEVNVTHMGGPLPIGGASELDLNGASDKLILDADGDTTISADTDDQIDFKVGGTDQIKLTDGVLAPTTTNDVDLGSTSLRFKDVAISNDIVHLDNAGNARTLYDRSENLFGNAGTNFYGYSIYLGGTGDANRLEDYEEGTWTPHLESNTNDEVDNYDSRSGVYTKIGRLVTLHCYIDAGTKGTVGGDYVRIGNFPFTPEDTNSITYTSATIGYWQNFDINDSQLMAATYTSNAFAYLFKTSTDNGYSQVTTSNLVDNARVSMTATYTVAT